MRTSRPIPSGAGAGSRRLNIAKMPMLAASNGLMRDFVHIARIRPRILPCAGAAVAVSAATTQPPTARVIHLRIGDERHKAPAAARNGSGLFGEVSNAR